MERKGSIASLFLCPKKNKEDHSNEYDDFKGIRKEGFDF